MKTCLVLTKLRAFPTVCLLVNLKTFLFGLDGYFIFISLKLSLRTDKLGL